MFKVHESYICSTNPIGYAVLHIQCPHENFRKPSTMTTYGLLQTIDIKIIKILCYCWRLIPPNKHLPLRLNPTIITMRCI